ncbi:hypothetical protein BHE90_017158 [Fusarium euwallaceae]|uniref:Uncharacterized protein n=1 Tax=Fusarium euwallaceae TaxID=1147111 RepID=A0A430KYF9_9HYPO|nr:hypothetical protein BHE90_017158 [Fusarium euwallaceae]
MPDSPLRISSQALKNQPPPPNAEPGVAYLLKKQMKAKKAVGPAFSSLLPSETRFQRASDTAKQVVEKYRDLLSSLTRPGLREVSKVVTEACLLDGKVTIVSLPDLREQQEGFLAEAREKEHRRQIRATRSILLREIEKLKAEWRENKEVVINGVTKKLQFKKWLEYTGKDEEYLSMDTQRSQMTQLLSEKTDGFMIDTQLPLEAPKPLNAVDWTALAQSDDTINFNLGRPASDEEDEEEEEEEEDLPVIELPRLRDNQATSPHALIRVISMTRNPPHAVPYASSASTTHI